MPVFMNPRHTPCFVKAPTLEDIEAIRNAGFSVLIDSMFGAAQGWIARTLADAGRGEGVVLFNGSNTSPEQTAIYQAWLTANKDGDLITVGQHQMRFAGQSGTRRANEQSVADAENHPLSDSMTRVAGLMPT